MLILLVLILLAPAVISVFLYGKFKRCKFSNYECIALLIIFAFLINAGVYAAVWLRGWSSLIWTLDSVSSMTSVSFCLKYMALSLVFAVAIPFFVSLVKAGKRK